MRKFFSYLLGLIGVCYLTILLSIFSEKGLDRLELAASRGSAALLAAITVFGIFIGAGILVLYLARKLYKSASKKEQPLYKTDILDSDNIFKEKK